MRLELNDYIQKAEKIMERLHNPTKETFTCLFKSQTDLFQRYKTDVYYFFDMKYDEVMKEGRIGTARDYRGCKVNLRNYKPSL